jgi:hypothetical protein
LLFAVCVLTVLVCYRLVPRGREAMAAAQNEAAVR